MGDKNRLTAAVQMEIDRFVEREMSVTISELYHQRSAEELLAFLTDETKLATPGFVLRRHIQSQGGLVSKEECADLSHSGNVPWSDEVISRAAAELSSISYRRHGIQIKPAQWKQYLAGEMPQGLQRNTIFKLAIVTGMGREDTIRLLMACGQAPYNIHSPLELICWFCQYIPGIYTWKDVERLLASYPRYAAASGGTAASDLCGEDFTRLLRQDVDQILRSGASMAEAEKALLELMAENRTELEGFSRTARSAYLRLLEYLNALYLPGKQVKLHRLITVMVEKQDWQFDDLFQASASDHFVFRGEAADDFGTPYVEYQLSPELGKAALFCKYYAKNAPFIEKGTRDVDRRDVLLLGYFLITGYMGAESGTREALWELTAQDGPMDRRIKLLREDLNALLEPYLILDEKQTLCLRVLNELLAEFGFHALYVPAAFDRFIYLSLLTDDPARTIRYLWRASDE